MTLIRLAGVAVVALSGSGASMGCSSDSKNPTPAESGDAGDLDATGASDGGGHVDAGIGGESTAGDDGGVGNDAGVRATADARCVPDGGDGAACNSCTTPDADPYNACSPYLTHCIHFDNQRVPPHPPVP